MNTYKVLYVLCAMLLFALGVVHADIITIDGDNSD